MKFPLSRQSSPFASSSALSRPPCSGRDEPNLVSPALPAIVGELGGLDHLTWVVTAFLLSSTVVILVYGKLGDHLWPLPA